MEHQVHVSVPDLIQVWLKPRQFVKLPCGVSVKFNKLVESSFDDSTQVLVLGKGTRIHDIGSFDLTTCLAELSSTIKGPHVPQIPMISDDMPVKDKPDKIEIFVSSHVLSNYDGSMTVASQNVRIDADPGNSECRIDMGSDGRLTLSLNKNQNKFKDSTSKKLFNEYQDRILKAIEAFDQRKSNSMPKKQLSKSSMVDWTYPGQVNIDPTVVTFVKTATPIRITKKEYKWGMEQPNSKFKASNGIKIKCDDGYIPGFENGSPNTLYFDNQVVDKDWIPRQGLKEYTAKMDRILIAVQEFKDAAAGNPK